jgi:hypothetical protein
MQMMSALQTSSPFAYVGMTVVFNTLRNCFEISIHFGQKPRKLASLTRYMLSRRRLRSWTRLAVRYFGRLQARTFDL